MTTFVQSFQHDIAAELDAALKKIRHCTDQLSDEQMWWRPVESMNSIGNLLLHLSGNVRQWIIAGVGGATDNRERQKEFDERGPLPKPDVLARIAQTVAEAKEVIVSATQEDLLTQRIVQKCEVTGLQAILHSVTHFHGHTQEIIGLTRQQLGDAYQFDLQL